MAVYTTVSAEVLAPFLARYDCGELRSLKGIAEGVENSNYLVETTGADGRGARFILTLYEKRVDPADLPFFIALLDHLGQRDCRVPRFIADRTGQRLQQLCGRSACLIEFLSGVSVSEPTPAQAASAGRALARLHLAAQGFPLMRTNSLGPAGWPPLAKACSSGLDDIAAGLAQRVAAELAHVDAHWPAGLPVSTIHADLFPDNVLMLDDEVTGLIDFYFSCTDIRAYDLAITLGAWAFAADGTGYRRDIGSALLAGYEAILPLSPDERDGFTTLCRGAALRFLLTRAYDWINTPPDALVIRKDPLAYLRRLDFFAATSAADLFEPF